MVALWAVNLEKGHDTMLGQLRNSVTPNKKLQECSLKSCPVFCCTVNFAFSASIFLIANAVIISLKCWKYGTAGDSDFFFFYGRMLLIGECLTLQVIFYHPVLLSGTICNHLSVCWGRRGQFVSVSPCCVYPW